MLMLIFAFKFPRSEEINMNALPWSSDCSSWRQKTVFVGGIFLRHAGRTRCDVLLNELFETIGKKCMLIVFNVRRTPWWLRFSWYHVTMGCSRRAGRNTLFLWKTSLVPLTNLILYNNGLLRRFFCICLSSAWCFKIVEKSSGKLLTSSMVVSSSMECWFTLKVGYRLIMSATTLSLPGVYWNS